MIKTSIAILASVCIWIIFRWQGSVLVTDITPNGIIALEFCDNLLRLEAILAKWNIAAAVKIVYLDFFIILSFTSMFYFGSLQIHKYSYRSFLRQFTKGAVIFSFVPGIFDVLENVGMLITLNGSRNVFILQSTSWVATFKFATAAIIVLYLLVSLLVIYAKSKKTKQLSKQEEYYSRT
jgi:hypothetical protein